METLIPRLKTIILTSDKCNIKIITNNLEKLSSLFDPDLLILDNTQIEVDTTALHTEIIISGHNFKERISFNGQEAIKINQIKDNDETSIPKQGYIQLLIKLNEMKYLAVINKNEIAFWSFDELIKYFDRIVLEGVGETFSFKLFDKNIKLVFSPMDFTHSNSFSYSYKLYVDDKFNRYIRIPMQMIDKKFLAEKLEKEIYFTEYLIKNKNVALKGDDEIILYERLIPNTIRDLDIRILNSIKRMVDDVFKFSNVLDNLFHISFAVFGDELRVQYVTKGAIQDYVNYVVELDYELPPSLIYLTKEDIEWIISEYEYDYDDDDYRLVSIKWLKHKLINLKNLREELLWE